MKRSTITFLLIIFCILQAMAYEQQSINITVNGKQRNMVVFTPNTLPEKSPLMIVTHGMNQDPEYQYGSDKIYEMIDTAKFVVAYLRSDGSTWDVGGTNDQTFVSKTIDEMYSRYNIDKDRVYWSGFSMGSMLIHHCISKMQNKIAAFAPTSGIQFSEQPWNSCTKPVNLLECIAYDDNVFGYEEYGIHAYIENYAKHDKHTKYSKTIGFKPFPNAWQNGDMEKWTGGPNGGEVWLYSYNNGGHWPTDQNRHLIWNFCKRFTLNQPKAKITQPAGETTYLNMTPDEDVTFPDINIEATAKAVVGSVEKVEFYDGNTLIETLTAAPYTATLVAPKAGKHELRVVVTDTNGKKGESSCLVNCVAADAEYNMANNFNCEDIVPQDWSVSNGNEQRVGGGLPNTSGCRILHFTNENRAFEYGLLVQNAKGVENAAWAKFGDNSARSYMKLHAGSYSLKSRVCNWNRPEFSPVTYTIETLSGERIASQVFNINKNIGGKTDTGFSLGKGQTFNFDIKTTGDYVFCIYADAAKNADFVLSMAKLTVKAFTASGIEEIERSPLEKDGCYDLCGRKIAEDKVASGQLKPGLYIIGGRKVVMK